MAMHKRLVKMVLVACIAGSAAVPTLAVAASVGVSQASAATCYVGAPTPTLYNGQIYGWGSVQNCYGGITTVCVELHLARVLGWGGIDYVENIGRRCHTVNSNNVVRSSYPNTCHPGYWYSVVDWYQNNVYLGTKKSLARSQGAC